jgi:hypothetical protein
MSNFFNKKMEGKLQKKRRQALIKRLNTERGWEMPLDTPIISQGANRAWLASGRFKWAFGGDIASFTKYGSAQAVHELLKFEKIEVWHGGELVGFNGQSTL